MLHSMNRDQWVILAASTLIKPDESAQFQV